MSLRWLIWALMSYFVGLEVKQNDGGIFVCQERDVKKLVEKFEMQDCNCVRNTFEHQPENLPGRWGRENW